MYKSIVMLTLMNLADYLRLGCRRFGLEFQEAYVARLPGGILLPSVGRIVGLGAPNGMPIFGNSRTVAPHWAALSKADFGISVLSDPIANREIDVEAFKEMITDWGWREDRSA